MKINNNSKYVLYIILFIIFILIRVIYVLQTSEIDNISFKGLAISSTFYPFGIIKNTIMHDCFLPLYYFIIGILRNDVLIRIFNSLLAFLNICVFILIGYKLYNKKLGLFLACFLSINHFFLYYTNLIAPYCLNFLIYSILIYFLILYFKRPSKRNFFLLNITNCLIVLSDSFGFLFVLCELFALHILGKRKKVYRKLNIKLFNFSFIAFLISFVVLIIQYAI